MTSQQRFLQTMGGNMRLSPPKWEYAYWGGTLNRWYREGLPKKSPPAIPTAATTITSSLYSYAWNYPSSLNQSEQLPEGLAVWGDATYWPTQGFPIDVDVHDYFGFDESVRLIDAEHVFYPQYECKIITEGDGFIIYKDMDGVTRKFLQKESVIPSPIQWPIQCRKDWEQIKNERVCMDTITKRLPINWQDKVKIHRKRSYPLAVGGYPCGLFGLQAHLMGYEHLFLNYYDDPGLIHDINSTFTDLWIALWEEILGQTSFDVLHIFEDMSSGLGSMVSPAIIKEFMLPYYKRITSFLKSRGVNIILLDTDGNCEQLIPLFIEGGITGLYPMETETGMDLLKIRNNYPNLYMMGGIPKMEVAKGKKRIDEILDVTERLLVSGNYIPFLDHSVPPHVSWEDFTYYREKLNSLIDRIEDL
jgi:Uroporphyrinogen decarboxylase (URO-D)